MKGVSRLFDITFGIDYSTGKAIVTNGIILGPGHPRLKVNGRGSSTQFDIARAFTGGTGIIITQQKRVYAGGKPLTSQFDLIVGQYQGIVLQGSHNVKLK